MKKENHRATRTDQWYKTKDGLSASKTLGLDDDVRRVAMCFCTCRLLLSHLNGQCVNCGRCRLPRFYELTKDHRGESWVQLPAEVQKQLADEFFSPDFVPPKGYNNFPINADRQAKAAIRPLEPPDPEHIKGMDYVNAAMAFAERVWELRERGWQAYVVNRTTKMAIPAAAKALLREPSVYRETDFSVSKSVKEAKREAADTGKAVTITVEAPKGSKLTRFDDWAVQMEEYTKTGHAFPLLLAIAESLAGFPCIGL